MDFTEILANELWVGAAPTLADLEEIKKLSGNKAVIVDLTRNPREEEWSKKLGLQYEDRTPKVEETFSAVPVSQLRLVSRLIEQHPDSSSNISVEDGRSTFIARWGSAGVRHVQQLTSYIVESLFETQKSSY